MKERRSDHAERARSAWVYVDVSKPDKNTATGRGCTRQGIPRGQQDGSIPYESSKLSCPPVVVREEGEEGGREGRGDGREGRRTAGL